jgi:hypothetical protein
MSARFHKLGFGIAFLCVAGISAPRIPLAVTPKELAIAPLHLETPVDRRGTPPVPYTRMASDIGGLNGFVPDPTSPLNWRDAPNTALGLGGACLVTGGVLLLLQHGGDSSRTASYEFNVSSLGAGGKVSAALYF